MIIISLVAFPSRRSENPRSRIHCGILCLFFHFAFNFVLNKPFYLFNFCIHVFLVFRRETAVGRFHLRFKVRDPLF